MKYKQHEFEWVHVWMHEYSYAIGLEVYVGESGGILSQIVVAVGKKLEFS